MSTDAINIRVGKRLDTLNRVLLEIETLTETIPEDTLSCNKLILKYTREDIQTLRRDLCQTKRRLSQWQKKVRRGKDG